MLKFTKRLGGIIFLTLFLAAAVVSCSGKQGSDESAGDHPSDTTKTTGTSEHPTDSTQKTNEHPTDSTKKP